MSENKAKILIADDDDSLRRVLEFQLVEAGYEVVAAENGAAALEIFTQNPVDCVITDWKMPKLGGAQLVERIAAVNAETPVVVITAFGDLEKAVRALKNGAFDFVTKPFDREAILLTVEKALKYAALLAENRRLRRLVHEDFRLAAVVGDSEKMRQVFQLIERVAATDVTVLIEGESGTGKELVARGIHFSGARRDKPFVAVNCAAIPEGLIEAELFGYKKGAFTGAVAESKGKFEEASGGTIFLDEISAMPLALQTRLLRVLQEQEITRLGENNARKINVRVIAATNENLPELIKQNEFREDLYYRLAVVPVKLPPLRERREDIPLLVEHFLRKAAEKYRLKTPRVEREVFRTFYNHSWMGNVRELENAVERMIVLSDGATLSLADVPENIREPQKTSENLWFDLPAEPINLETVESEIIRQALKRFEGNQSQAARYLGITRSALIYRMQKYGLE